ncbi:hypothetical protein [Syntrophorhabdus aromaticivorans]|uniref:Uncharacterized protein n=1 Tax=Syntrophorhabdus aromaticivorans TaxID=328301 RepID=A0A971M6L4_9BACT|nr:hypothetical protein [Syntrophorhabdus aromaticivorans]NLW36835.1 hypothetical protein [Syntrophorhabdus aromaticivorans]
MAGTIRILTAKPGLDGYGRGAKVVALSGTQTMEKKITERYPAGWMTRQKRTETRKTNKPHR